MCGTDFSMMTTLFPTRSRGELKAKFKREDKRNPGQISLALQCQEFDPDEGWTSSEEESEPSSKIRKQESESPMKIRKVEDLNQLQNETPVKAKKRPFEVKEGKKPARKDTWKSQIKKGVLGNLLDDGPHDSSITINNSTSEKKKKYSRNRITIDVDSFHNKPNKKDKPSVKIEKTLTIKEEKQLKTVDVQQFTNNAGNEQEENVRNELPTYLVYDPSDPLGTRVPAAITRLSASDFESSEFTEESQLQHIRPVAFVDNADSVTNEHSQDSQSDNSSTPLIKQSKKLTELKVIPPPYRVPGPGGSK